MRYLSARSSGSTGIHLCRALRIHGFLPFLMGSAEARLRAPDLVGEEYGSTRDLMARMEVWIRAHPDAAVVHAAAVGDYEVSHPNASKTPSGKPEWTLVLHPTPKIADHVRGWGHTGPYVTFKAAAPETTDADVVAIARKQRERTGCDLVFANVLGRTAEGVYLVADEVRRFDHRKDAITALVEWIASRKA
jgi:phosphopantothenoylcysteine synthetase/decarboxylase